MSWMDRLERKMGKFAIPHITRWMLIANLLGYILYLLANVNGVARMIFNLLYFSASGILHGQVWRLVSWIFIPTGSMSIWSVLFLVCLLMMGENMENMLGTFRMNVYFIGGILLSDIGGIIIHLVVQGIYGVPLDIQLSMYYILFSLYLMLGLFMPDATVRLYFVLPIRMKWLMILYIAGMAWEIFCYFRMGVGYGIIYCPEIIFALVNLGLFVYFCKRRVSHRQRKRQKEYQRKVEFTPPRPGSGIAKHKCVICGRTELTNPELMFRYCSKCEGSYEYCEEHLFTHNHIRKM